jgi:heme-degrading monooxygenase HmoA
MALAVKGGTVLFSEMTPPDGTEDAFNDWYDNHHSPSHVRGVPGFLSAHRYRSPHGPHYLAVYELDSPEALEHEEYRKRKYTPDAPTKTRSPGSRATSPTRRASRSRTASMGIRSTPTS